ncbi:helix-turn-helix domain-containing protein [Cohnella sp. GCM10020058]|uniref:helix-turn-helix domain-containing protein n=1 Tax=Cohnella sp. GCM10020058 TaxID=3317330 RepID=UPI0036434603
MPKTGVNRIFWSFFPIVFVIALTLLSMSYMTLNEMSKQSAKKANEVLSHDISRMIDSSLQDVEQKMLALLKEPRIERFFRRADEGGRLYTDYQAAGALKEAIADNPLIQSIVLFRSSDQKVLTPWENTTIDQFADKKWIALHIASLTPFRWEGPRELQITPGSVEPANVVSLVKIANLSDRSMIMVNISTEALGALIHRMADSNLTYIQLVDDEDKLLASGLPASEKDAGNEWSHVRSDYTGWTIRSGIYKSGIVEWIASLFYLWLAVGLTTVVIAVLWLINASRRNYKPIRQIASKIYGIGDRKYTAWPDKPKDEFGLIENAIEHLVDRSNILQEENKENLAYRKRHMFMQMLEDSSGTKRWEEELRRFAVDPNGRDFVVSVLEIDRFASFSDMYRSGDQILMKQVLQSVLSEMAANESVVIWAEWIGQERLGVLFGLSRERGDYGQLVHLSEQMNNWIREHLSFTATIALGSKVQEIANISVSYKLTRTVLDYKPSLGSGRVIRPEDIGSGPEIEISRCLKHIRELCRSYRAGEEEWSAHLGDLYALLDGRLLSREQLANLLSYLSTNLFKEMEELPGELREFWDNEAYPEVRKAIAETETLEDAKRTLSDTLHGIFKLLRKERELRQGYGIIMEVRQYISDHFCNPDLSLNMLCDQFGIRASHLSRIFKEELGINFVDFVGQVRSEKAIELLRESDLAIQDIAAEVGYLHVNTFNRVFKRHTGNTPGHYRRQ